MLNQHKLYGDILLFLLYQLSLSMHIGPIKGKCYYIYKESDGLIFTTNSFHCSPSRRLRIIIIEVPNWCSTRRYYGMLPTRAKGCERAAGCVVLSVREGSESL